jgi:hypothetical protein
MLCFTMAVLQGRGDLDGEQLLWERLQKALRFTEDVTKPNGKVVQVGDNDSGRFFILSPQRANEALDHRSLLRAGQGLLLDRAPQKEGALVAALARTQRPIFLPLSIDNYQPIKVLPNSRSNLERWLKVVGNLSSEQVYRHEWVTKERGWDLRSYPDFGIFIFRGERSLISLRCGAIGQEGNGAHAHNDMLALELYLDGRELISDPGSFTYTPNTKLRNAYRSIQAHFAPRLKGEEPGRLDVGLFVLPERAFSQVVCVTESDFLGVHRGFSQLVGRWVSLQQGKVQMVDFTLGPKPLDKRVYDFHANAKWKRAIPFSPAYGIQEDEGVADAKVERKAQNIQMLNGEMSKNQFLRRKIFDE